MTAAELNSIFHEMTEHFNMFETMFGEKLNMDEEKYSVVLENDIVAFAFYLAAADGKFAPAEAKYIGEVLDMDASEEEMAMLTVALGLSSGQGRQMFESRPFKSFVLFLACDKLCAALGMPHDYIGKYVGFFTQFGIGVVSADGQLTESENSDIQYIVNNMMSVAQKEMEANEQVYAIAMEYEKQQAMPEPESEPVVEEPVVEEMPEPEPVIEEAIPEPDPVIEDVVSQEIVVEPQITIECASTMSVEEIVSNVNDTKKGYDFASSLEISIGENGGSYIAMNISADLINDKLQISVDGMIPAMVMGNCLSVAIGTQIIRYNLCTGDITIKKTDAAVVTAMNSSILPVAERNTKCIEKNSRLCEYVSYVICILDNIDTINNALNMAGSPLSIMSNVEGIISVVDTSGVVHSLEEVLWVLSL